MEAFNGMVDILFGYDTDIHFENGDLMTTSGIDFIEREVYKILITSQNDWKVDSKIGVSPKKFIGEPNTREVAKEIELFVMDGLRDTLMPAQVLVRAIPVSLSSLIVLIEIFAQGNEITSIPFEFDFINGFTILNKRDERVQQTLSSNKYAINDITNQRRPNKYWDRLRNNSN